MKFTLDYERMILLDAEDLAEAGIKRAYGSIMPRLREYVSEPAEVHEVVDNETPSYSVNCSGLEYPIYAPALLENDSQSWGRAAYALFKIQRSTDEVGIPLIRNKRR